MQETATQFRDTIMSRIQFGDCKINSFVVTYKIPTLCTLRNMLLEQPEPEAKQIALSLELYTTGSLDIFGKQSNVDLDKCVVVFENEFSAQFFNSAWRQFRKRNAYLLQLDFRLRRESKNQRS